MSIGGEKRPRRPLLRAFIGDDRGATALMVAVLLPVLVGMSALAIDVGLWNVSKRQAQGAADQAAYTAAVAEMAGVSQAQAIIDAKAIAANTGFVDGVGGVSVAVNNPPTQGDHVGDDAFWEVVVQKPQSSFFSRIFLATDPNARAIAVAGGGGPGTGKACIIGLSPNAANTIHFDNNAGIGASGCAVYSNSSAATALVCDNNANIAAATYVVGGVTGQNNCRMTNSTNLTGQTAIADPYADVVANRPATCTTPAGKAISSGSISPGRHCGGLNVSNNGSITLQPGVHYIDGSFVTKNNVTLNATGGVTIVLTTNNAGTLTIDMGNNMVTNIVAPTTGPTAGIAFMSRYTSTATTVFSNNGSLNIEGAVYLPNMPLQLRNNVNSNLCTQFVAKTIHFRNNAMVVNPDRCDSAGVKGGSGPTAVALVE